jgi:hypothetical protein
VRQVESRPREGVPRGTGRGKDAIDTIPSLGEEATRDPEADERLAHPDRLVDVPAVERVIQRAAEIVVVALEPLEPRHLLGAAQMWRRLLGDSEHEVEVSTTRRVFFAGLDEPLAGEGVNRLQHREARFAVRLLVLSQQAVAHERRQRLEHVAGIA